MKNKTLLNLDRTNIVNGDNCNPLLHYEDMSISLSITLSISILWVQVFLRIPTFISEWQLLLCKGKLCFFFLTLSCLWIPALREAREHQVEVCLSDLFISSWDFPSPQHPQQHHELFAVLWLFESDAILFLIIRYILHPCLMILRLQILYIMEESSCNPFFWHDQDGF